MHAIMPRDVVQEPCSLVGWIAVLSGCGGWQADIGSIAQRNDGFQAPVTSAWRACVHRCGVCRPLTRNPRLFAGFLLFLFEHGGREASQRSGDGGGRGLVMGVVAAALGASTCHREGS
jgi:hypothetical protein